MIQDTESREAIKDALSGSQETMFDKIKVPELPRIRKEVGQSPFPGYTYICRLMTYCRGQYHALLRILLL